MTMQPPETRALDLFGTERVFIIGLGRTGLATARALRKGGAEVHCWDDRDAARTAAATEGFTVTDPGAPGAVDGAAAMVMSPGIPLTHPEPHASVRAAAAAGVPILGDADLLFRAEPRARFVGITGTNGKSTTTALIGHILRRAGRDAAIGGNLGVAAPSLPTAEIYVLEMSSYQLDLTPSAMFDISVLLNITPDHLDRHGGMDGYIAAKRRILRPRAADSLAVIGDGTPESAALADALIAEGRAVLRIGAKTEPTATLIDAGRCLSLMGDHNKENAAAAFAVCQALGLGAAKILAGIGSFPGLAHRQERIATLDGVTFINDSKATNADATAKALSAFERVYWIAGGKAKGGGYDVLDDRLPRVRHAFLVGEAASAIAEWIAGRVPITLSGGLSQAVAAASEAARRDDAPGPVLLSPACASFDQFPNFEARGDAFRDIVLALPATERAVHSNREAV